MTQEAPQVRVAGGVHIKAEGGDGLARGHVYRVLLEVPVAFSVGGREGGSGHERHGARDVGKHGRSGDALLHQRHRRLDWRWRGWRIG